MSWGTVTFPSHLVIELPAEPVPECDVSLHGVVLHPGLLWDVGDGALGVDGADEALHLPKEGGEERGFA